MQTENATFRYPYVCIYIYIHVCNSNQCIGEHDFEREQGEYLGEEKKGRHDVIMIPKVTKEF